MKCNEKAYSTCQKSDYKIAKPFTWSLQLYFPIENIIMPDNNTMKMN